MPNSMNSKPWLALAIALALISPASLFAADALVKPVPNPDLSRLPAATADDLRKTRAEFDQLKPTLVGDALAQAHAMLGAAYARAGQYDAAAVALDDASLLAPNDARWVYAQGLVARMQKNNAAAQNYFEHALVMNQEYLPIRIAVVGIRVEQGDLENARKLLGEFTAAHDNEPIAFAMLGDIALRQKRYADAIEQTNRALKLDPKATKLYAQLADAYTGAGDAKSAAAARAKAGDGVPALGDPIGMGLMPGTIASATPAAAPAAGAKPAPKPQTSSDPVAQAVHEASFMLATGQYDVARNRLDAALRDKPNDASLLGTYARVEAAAGNFAQARTRADAAVVASPNSGNSQLTLGMIEEMAGDDRAAQRAYEKAISLDPKLGEARLRLGNLLMRGQRNDDAAAQYRAAVQVDSNDIEAWSRLVAANVAAGKCPAALKEINGALAKDANNRALLQLFVRLTSTCAVGNPEERRMALDYGGKIYRESEAAPVGETYALALAANGKWDDAVKTQQGAMFVLVRNGRRADLPGYREFLQKFQAHQLPDRPWPATNTLFKPPRLAAETSQTAAPAPPKK